MVRCLALALRGRAGALQGPCRGLARDVVIRAAGTAEVAIRAAGTEVGMATVQGTETIMEAGTGTTMGATVAGVTGKDEFNYSTVWAF